MVCNAFVCRALHALGRASSKTGRKILRLGSSYLLVLLGKARYLQPKPACTPYPGVLTMVPKYTEYFLIQIAKLNRQQQNNSTPTLGSGGIYSCDTLRHQPMGSWSHDCSNSAGLGFVSCLYLAGVALHQQPMGSRSHDCSNVGCGGIPCSILVSPNASLHKWQQAVASGMLPYMVPQNWIQARTIFIISQIKKVLLVK